MRSTATLANMKSSSTIIWDLRSSARTRHSEVIIFKDFNSLTPGRCGNDFKPEISEHILQGYVHEHFLRNCSQAMATEYFSWHVNMVQVMAWSHRQQAITSSNADPDLCHHMATVSYIWGQQSNLFFSIIFFLFKKLAMMTDIIIIMILSEVMA